MSYQADIKQVIEDLADHGEKVLVEAIMLDVEEALDNIQNIQDPYSDDVTQQADVLCLTVYHWLVDLVTPEDCGKGRDALMASQAFNQARLDPTRQALYFYQLACADLAQVVVDDTVPTALKVMEDLVKFWCELTGQSRKQAQEGRVAWLQDYLYTWRRETLTLAPLPREVSESRSRPSLLAT
jgi:hypothetical protein